MPGTLMEETSILQDGKNFDWQKMEDSHIATMQDDLENRDPTSPEAVAQRLQFIRAAFDLEKRSDLADLIPIDRSSYTKIENGTKPLKPEWAYRIWQLFGVPMEYTYRGAMKDIPDALRIAIMQNRKPRH